MAEVAGGADAELVGVMTRAADRVLSSEERPYDIALDAMGALLDLMVQAQHGGIAYVLWAEISDLFDDPRGRSSEELCNAVAYAAAKDWLTVDRASRDGVASYFARWDPHSGSAWAAHVRPDGQV